MQCSAVMELVVDGNVTPESDVVVTRKRERSDDESEDVKKLQKEAEVKEEMRHSGPRHGSLAKKSYPSNDYFLIKYENLG